MTNRLGIPGLIGLDLTREHQRGVRAAGEYTRDASGELVLQSAVGVEAEGGERRHFGGSGAEIEDQEAAAAGVGFEVDVLAVEGAVGAGGDDKVEGS